MKNINLIALNVNFEIISLLSYTNLQWNRKYYEFGFFSVQIPLEQYSSDIKYIYTKDRPEMGEVTQINYTEQSGFKAIQLSGYFLERKLEKRVVYPAGTGNIDNTPTWASVKGTAEDVALTMFNDFKDVVVGDVSAVLDIGRRESQGRGNEVEHTRGGEKLGTKLYSILTPSELSYRIIYDFLNSAKVLEIWSGLDRTNGQYENNPVTFSTKYGNIKNPNILLDESNYCNCCIVAKEAQADGGTGRIRAVLEATDNDYSFSYLTSTLRSDDYTTEAEYLSAMDNEAHQDIESKIKTVNVEFDALVGSYEYMTDFDLGDKCNIEIPEIELSAESRLIGCFEVIKSGKHSLTLEFGTPIIKNTRRK